MQLSSSSHSSDDWQQAVSAEDRAARVRLEARAQAAEARATDAEASLRKLIEASNGQISALTREAARASAEATLAKEVAVHETEPLRARVLALEAALGIRAGAHPLQLEGGSRKTTQEALSAAAERPV